MFGGPRKSRSTSGFGGTLGYCRLGPVDFSIFSFLTFSMSRNLFFVVSHGRYVRVTSKIQVNFRFYRNSKVLTVGSHGFSYFFHSLTFSKSRFDKNTMFG